MKHLIPTSPLLSVIAYQGQDYFTSQYFHAQYVTNSPHSGKYRRHADFIRTIRSIASYTIYVDRSDIVALTFDRIKSEATQDLRQWTTLFHPVLAKKEWPEHSILMQAWARTHGVEREGDNDTA